MEGMRRAIDGPLRLIARRNDINLGCKLGAAAEGLRRNGWTAVIGLQDGMISIQAAPNSAADFLPLLGGVHFAVKYVVVKGELDIDVVRRASWQWWKRS